MLNEPETTGTPEPEPQDGNAQEATGTAEGAQDGGNAQGQEQGGLTQDERAELEALRRQKGQALAEKSGYEAAKQELERLRGAGTPPMDPSAATNAQAAALVARLSAKEQELTYRATVLNDDDALIQLATLAQLRQTQQALEYRTQMLEVERDDRGEVERVMREAGQRGEQLSTATARELVQLRRLKEKSADLTTKEQEIAAAQDARARGVVATRQVGVPRSEVTKSTMTSEEFAREWDRLDDAGRDKLNRAINSRQVRITR